MRINKENISMVRGDSEALYVSCMENGVAREFVVGDTVFFTIKRNTSTDEKVIQKIVTEFHDGKALVEILPADTKTLPIGRYVYDIQITFANGTVKTVVGPATFEIAAEVTYE